MLFDDDSDVCLWEEGEDVDCEEEFDGEALSLRGAMYWMGFFFWTIDEFYDDLAFWN